MPTASSRRRSLDVHYVPGEHDIIDEDRGKLYRERYGRGSKGAGWYSFDGDGVHFIGLVNVVDLKAGGLGNLGNEQLAWLEDDVKGRSSSQPIVVFAHIPLWTVYPEWGWGTEDSAQALGYLKKFGSVTVLNGHIHQVMQKVEGNVTFHTARSTAFPQPAPARRLAGADEGAGRQAAQHAWHRQRDVQAERAASRHHRHAVAGLSANMVIRKIVQIQITDFERRRRRCGRFLLAATPALAEDVAVKIGNFTFGPQELKVKAGTTVTWTNEDDIPHTVVSPNNFPFQGARYRWDIFIHLHDAGNL